MSISEGVEPGKDRPVVSRLLISLWISCEVLWICDLSHMKKYVKTNSFAKVLINY